MIFVNGVPHGARPAGPPQPKFMGTLHVMKPLNLVVAVDAGGGFGKDGKIPWYFPEDFKHFKETTQNGICIMGRATYDDMLEVVKSRQKEPKEIEVILPNRTSYVLTSQQGFIGEGVKVAHSLLEAVQDVPENDTRPMFVIGGEKLYIESLPWVERIFMTLVNDYYDCDRFFPIDYVKKNFDLVFGREGQDPKLKFMEYRRKQK